MSTLRCRRSRCSPAGFLHSDCGVLCMNWQLHQPAFVLIQIRVSDHMLISGGDGLYYMLHQSHENEACGLIKFYCVLFWHYNWPQDCVVQQPSVLLTSCWPGLLHVGLWTDGHWTGWHWMLMESSSHTQVLQSLVHVSPGWLREKHRNQFRHRACFTSLLVVVNGCVRHVSPHLFGFSIRSNTIWNWHRSEICRCDNSLWKIFHDPV